MKKIVLPTLVSAALALAACGGGEVEFQALDAEGLAGVLDAGFTEESGFKGQITADFFSEEDVAEFNTLAEEACGELKGGIDSDDYAEFQEGLAEGAGDMDDLIDADALVLAIVDASCPSYSETVEQAIAG